MTATMKRTRYYYDILDSLEEIFKYFNIEYIKNDSYYQLACPIHCGTNRTGCVVYTNTGIFSCYTNHCHTHYTPNVVGLLRGILSTRNGKEVSQEQAIRFFKENFYKERKLSQQDLEKREFCDLVLDLAIQPREEKLFDIRITGKQEPSQYLIDRGFSPEVLKQYNVFVAKAGPFQGRTVVPVFHEYKKDKYAGFVARTHADKCNLCNRYHDKGDCGERLSKWMNNKDFKRHKHLYNFCQAKEKITENGVIIITEGPLDCLNLVQHGVDCSVAIFGSSLSDCQSYMIEGASPRTIIIATDHDEAGMKAEKQIFDRFYRGYKVVNLPFSTKDPGELTKTEIENIIIPFIDKYKNKI